MSEIIKPSNKIAEEIKALMNIKEAEELREDGDKLLVSKVLLQTACPKSHFEKDPKNAARFMLNNMEAMFAAELKTVRKKKSKYDQSL